MMAKRIQCKGERDEAKYYGVSASTVWGNPILWALKLPSTSLFFHFGVIFLSRAFKDSNFSKHNFFLSTQMSQISNNL
jgi:hypothetical protein